MSTPFKRNVSRTGKIEFNPDMRIDKLMKFSKNIQMKKSKKK